MQIYLGIQAEKRKSWPNLLVLQPHLAVLEVSSQTECSVQAGLSWQKAVSSHERTFCRVVYFCRKSTHHMFLNNLISCATSGHSVICKIPTHGFLCYIFVINIDALALCLQCVFDFCTNKYKGTPPLKSIKIH